VCIALLGGIQPGKLAGYIREAVSGGKGDDGLLQRFGLLVWPDVPAEWKDVDRYTDTDAKQKAFAVFQRLDAMQSDVSDDGEPVPREYRFAPDAQEVFRAWRTDFETALRTGQQHPAMESHLAKYRKLVPALALVIALADGEEAVSHKSLLMALGWIEYLQSHAERVYAAGTRPNAEGARALLDKILEGKVSSGFAVSDVYLKGWQSLADVKDARHASEVLADLGYLRRIETPPGVSGGRPKVRYLIHPNFCKEG
jgi:putative DNA primase/helicase